MAEGARRERKFKSELGGGALLDIGIYNLGFFHMITETAPEGFQSEVHMTEYGTDDYSEIELEYQAAAAVIASRLLESSWIVMPVSKAAKALLQ